VPDERVAELAMWRTSSLFDRREQAALALTEALVAGLVDDETFAAAGAPLAARRQRTARLSTRRP
jgi:alkylhydroperoxidase family enzyme